MNIELIDVLETLAVVAAAAAREAREGREPGLHSVGLVYKRLEQTLARATPVAAK